VAPATPGAIAAADRSATADAAADAAGGGGGANGQVARRAVKAIEPEYEAILRLQATSTSLYRPGESPLDAADEVTLAEAAAKFGALDVDRNGSLDRDEFAQLLIGHDLVHGGHHTHKQARAMFDAADRNGDGRIDFNEFLLMREVAARKRLALKDGGAGAGAARGRRSRSRRGGGAEGGGADGGAPPVGENPSWVDAARAVHRARNEQKVADAHEADRLVRTRLDTSDSVYDLADDELDALCAMLGGEGSLHDAGACASYVGLLGLRLGRAFSDDEVAALLGRLQDLHGRVRARELLAAMREGTRLAELAASEGAATAPRRRSVLKIYTEDEQQLIEVEEV